MQFIKDYMHNDKYRHELNVLSNITFGFDFENWFNSGCFDYKFIPYSYESDGLIVSNVSVNLMEFCQCGNTRYYVQIGSVMTHPDYKKQGLAASLMDKVLKDYMNQCEGFYLFSKLSAVDFYKKCGFTEGVQYRYELKNEYLRKIKNGASQRPASDCFNKVCPADKVLKDYYIETLNNSIRTSEMEHLDKASLHMFYTHDLHQIYYSKPLDCFAAVKTDKNTLYVQSIICSKKINLTEIITYFKDDYQRLILGFTPLSKDSPLFDAKRYDGENQYRLFIYGNQLKEIENKRLYFPELSHA